MIRKWSYIKFFSKTTILPNQWNLKISSWFQFKVFRKNTRFKKYNLQDTLFVRKLVMLRRRRLGWKYYIRVSSNWALTSLKYKKLISFLQAQLLYKYEVCYVNNKLLSSNSNQLRLIDKGLYSINYTFLKHSTFFIFFMNKFAYKKINSRKNIIVRTVQFNQLSNIQKLTTLGFNLTNLKVSGKLVNNINVLQCNFYAFHKKCLLQTSMLLTINLRRIYVYLVLLKLKT